MSSSVKTFAGIDDLFNASIDDLADLPSFETPPAGSYLLTASMEVKEVNQKQCVEASFTVNETVELADPATSTPVANGTKFSTLFQMDNEFGVGNLKKFLKPFAEHYGTSNIGKLVRDEIKNVSISGLIKTRKDKNDPDKVYGTVTNITVA